MTCTVSPFHLPYSSETLTPSFPARLGLLKQCMHPVSAMLQARCGIHKCHSKVGRSGLVEQLLCTTGCAAAVAAGSIEAAQ